MAQRFLAGSKLKNVKHEVAILSTHVFFAKIFSSIKLTTPKNSCTLTIQSEMTCLLENKVTKSPRNNNNDT